LLSCPRIAVQRTACFRTPMSRASTSLGPQGKDVDGRDEPGHDGLFAGPQLAADFADLLSSPVANSAIKARLMAACRVGEVIWAPIRSVT
jgi:hypothetical protein